MNIFEAFRDRIAAAVADMQGEGLLPAELRAAAFTVEPPRDPAHGDISTNAALVLAKPAGTNPRALADALAERLAGDAAIAAAEVAGPGFVNLRLSAAFWQEHVRTVLAEAENYGRGAKKDASPVNVEYVSANPTGPLHMGHCRGAVIGDTLARLLSYAGYEVTTEYYVNDAGAQIDTLARSLHLRYREALGEDIGGIPEGYYPGNYLIPVGRAMAKRHGDRFSDAPEGEWLEIFRRAAVDAMMDLIRADLACLGIRQEVFFSESALHESGRIAETIHYLEDKGLIYEGVLEPPKGKAPEDWEPRPQRLFRATEFGDDTDRALQKSDGSYTYFAADIAYHRDKVERGFLTQINVWGADHGGYVKRMKAAVKAVSGGRANLDIKICQMVRLSRAGAPVKMSKRSGSFITIADVVDEVGADVVRLIMLTRKPEAPLEFDFEKVVEQSRDNPVFYIQYAHARMSSALRKAAEEFPEIDFSRNGAKDADLSRLVDEGEIALVAKMAEWPRLVETAAAAHEPHRVVYYLNELASDFHAYWNRGNDAPALRVVIAEDEGLTRARAALVEALRQVIAGGLRLLGVEPKAEMR